MATMALSGAAILSLLSNPFILGLGVVLYILGSYVFSWYRLRHINGPWLASISYLWMFYTNFTGKQAIKYKEITDKYGHLVRVGPNDLLTDDAEVIRRMNSARSPYKRSNWYTALRMNPYHEGLFSILDTNAHGKLKAQLSFGYGGKENPDIENGIDEQLKNMSDLIRRKYISDDKNFRPMDMAATAQYFTLDTITRIAYGKEFGHLETDSDVYSYIKTVESYVPIIVACAEVPILGKLLFSNTMLKLFGPKPTDKEGMGKLLAMAKDVVSNRFAPDAETKLDMLGSFIRHGVTRQQCETEVLFQIIAGSDTTATAIRGTMLQLLASPSAYQKLQEEIDKAIAENRVSSPAKHEEGKQLEYLQAVIYEGLRVALPFSGLNMKEVPAEGDTINGQFIPGGTRIGVAILGLQRSKEIYGADADLFRPERWLDIDPDRKRDMAQVVEMVFGYGRWGCAGKPVAFMELNKVYIELFRSFDFQLVRPTNPMVTWNTNMFFDTNMPVRITERSPKAS